MEGVALDPAPDRVDTTLVWQEGRYFHVSGAGYYLLSLLQSGPLLPSALTAQLRDLGCSDSEERVAAIVRRLEELQVVTFENAHKPASKKAPFLDRLLGRHDDAKHKYLTVRVCLLPSRAVMKLCRPLANICGPGPLRYAFPFLVVLQVIFCCKWGATSVSNLPHLSTSNFILLVAFNYACLMFHECGHAAACISESIMPGEIGAGLYLYMPVFYTDVSAAWRIPRSKRLVIDASGMYFSLLASTVASGVFLYTRDSMWGALAIATDVATLANLNPALRMDAYWLMSDWLGIDDLMQMNRDTAKAVLDRVRGRRHATTPRHRVKGWKLNVYRVYFGGVSLFTLYTVIFFAYVGIPAEIHYVTHNAPTMFVEACHLPRNLRSFALDMFKNTLAMIPIMASVWMLVKAGMRRLLPAER